MHLIFYFQGLWGRAQGAHCRSCSLLGERVGSLEPVRGSSALAASGHLLRTTFRSSAPIIWQRTTRSSRSSRPTLRGVRLSFKTTSSTGRLSCGGYSLYCALFGYFSLLLVNLELLQPDGSRAAGKIGGVLRGNTIRGNRPERFWEGKLPLRGSLRGPLRGMVSEFFRAF